jgi:hypothetical protein
MDLVPELEEARKAVSTYRYIIPVKTADTLSKSTFVYFSFVLAMD